MFYEKHGFPGDYFLCLLSVTDWNLCYTEVFGRILACASCLLSFLQSTFLQRKEKYGNTELELDHYVRWSNSSDVMIKKTTCTPLRNAQLNMRMNRWDTDNLTDWVVMQRWKQAGVNKSRTERRTVEDLLNEAILHVDIGMEGLVIIHDPPTFDQKPVAL